MTPRTIAAVLPSPEGASALGRAASGLAQTWEAHLIGMHAVAPTAVPAGAELSLSPVLAQGVREAQLDAARQCRTRFAKAAPEAEWREMDSGDIVGTVLASAARSADLVLTLQGDRAPERGGRHLQEAVIRGAGRPVLMLRDAPCAPFDAALIGWADTREAARTAFDLLPLLTEGARIRLVSVGEGEPMGRGGMADMATSLGRRGFDVTAAHRPLAGLRAHEALVREARDCGAAVTAIGGFGHSPAWHFVNGAVTNALMDASETPVLVSR